MKRTDKTFKAGFSLVELLTAVAVIGILLALLVPALNRVQDAALTAKQKAQFHSISIALEAVYTDTGDYPPSAWNTTLYYLYPASQRLAEAMIGQDGFGLHKNSRWVTNGTALDNTGTAYPLYAPDQPIIDKSERFGPYLELENANAVKLSDIYPGSGIFPMGWRTDKFVLCDQYKVVKHVSTGKMGGMPILYYRANRNLTGHNASAADMDPATPNTNTYDINDALCGGKGIPMQTVPFQTSVAKHPMATAANSDDFTWFYNRIQNPNFTSPARPYKSDSFILHSAGPDGLYGNSDDIFNFDE